MVEGRLLSEVAAVMAPKRSRERGMQRRGNVVKMMGRQTSAGRIQSLVSHLSVKGSFLQLFQKATVSVRMLSTGSKRLLSTSEDEDAQTPLQTCTLGTTGRVRELVTKSGELIPEMNKYKVSRESL